jgi:hypothetical protein
VLSEATSSGSSLEQLVYPLVLSSGKDISLGKASDTSQETGNDAAICESPWVLALHKPDTDENITNNTVLHDLYSQYLNSDKYWWLSGVKTSDGRVTNEKTLAVRSVQKLLQTIKSDINNANAAKIGKKVSSIFAKFQ